MHIPKSGTIGVTLHSSTTEFSCNDIDKFHRVEGSAAHLQGIRYQGLKLIVQRLVKVV